MERRNFRLSRRDLLKLSILTGGATMLGGRAAWALQDTCGQLSIENIDNAVTTCGAATEPMPFSPLILSPFADTTENQLPIPKAMRP